jgi:hypothetical protein
LIKQKTIKLVFATSQLKKYIALRSKDWLAWNNVAEWRGMSTCRLLFEGASIIKIQLSNVGLLQSRHHHHLIEM